MTAPAKPPEPPALPEPPAQTNPIHLGELVRLLREASGLRRRELADAVGIPTATLRNFETWRHCPTPQTLRKLMQHPAMARLTAMAREAGLVLDLDAAADKNQGKE